MSLGTHVSGGKRPPSRTIWSALWWPLLLLAGLAGAAPGPQPTARRTGDVFAGNAALRQPVVPAPSPPGITPVQAGSVGAPSPTGRTPRLLWSPEQQAVWNRMRAENHPWWQLLKSNADRSATSQRRAGDMGVWGTLAYQVTGDPTYARKAWTMITTGANGHSYLDPGFVPADGRNFTREAFVDFVWMYDWLYPALSPGERQLFLAQLNRWADLVLNKVPGVNWGTRLTDSDETVGHYFGLAFLDLATAPENPRAGTFLTSTWNETYTSSVLNVGGLTATGSNLTSTMRNAIRRYVEMSEGGQWVESSEYNMNTMRILLWGARGVQTATGIDYFPEITRFASQLGLSQLYEVTPDLTDAYQWGDVQQPRNIEIWLRANLVGTLSGWLRNDAATAAYLQQLTDELVERYPHVASASSSLPASFFLFHNPYAARADWRASLPKGYLAPGYGFQFFHDGWNAGDSFFGASFAPSPSVDHGLPYLSTFQLYRRGEWAVTHPLGYQRNQAEYLNSMLIGGLSAVNEFKGLIAQEFGPNEEYAYFAGGCGGQYYRQPYWNPPPTFLHEWTRTLFYLPSADKLSDTVIVFDRTNAENPRNLGQLERYLAADRERILSAPANKQWIIHSPVAPSVGPEGIAWSTPGGQQVRVSTLLPAAQKRVVLNEADLWGNTVALSERGYQTRIIPAVEQRWDTFLNVVQASDPGATLRNTLVRSTAREAEGVRVERGGQNDALVLFSASPSRRLLRYGYTLQWTAGTAKTEAYLLDLDPTWTWTATLDGLQVPVFVSPRGVGRAVLPGTGPHTLVLASSAPADDTAPAVPDGLTAATGDRSATLSWRANTEADLAGYRVFRAESQHGPFASQTDALLKAPGFTQDGLTNGMTYWYCISAVDTSGNESKQTAPVPVTPGTYAIRGLVRQGGTPLPNVKVSAGEFSAVTDNSGAYVITGVPEGTYQVRANRAGYVFSEPVTVRLAPDASANFTASGSDGIRINSGGNGYQSESSGPWMADNYVTGGARFTYTNRDIAGTNDDPLYLAVRYGKAFTYQVPVVPGSYTVKLHFAECWFTTPGNRRFNVLINGGKVLSNFDIVAEGGANTAVVRTFEATAGEQGITIDFQDVLNDAVVSGIEVVPVRTFAVSGRVSVNAGSPEGVLISAGGRTALTGADGTYTLADLEPGTYAVTASKAEYTFGSPRTVTIGPDQAGVDFSGTRVTYQVSGTVRDGDRGLGGVTISAGGVSATTAADGSYTLAGLPSGTYTVECGKRGYAFDGPREVTLGPSRTGVDFTRRPVLSPAAFKLSDGKPVSGGSALDLEFTANSATVTAAAFDLAFDPSLVAFVEAKAGSLPTGVTVQANDRGNGRVRVVIFGGQTPWQNGRVASVTLRAAGGGTGDLTTQVTLKLPDSGEEGVQVSDPEGLSANASGTGGVLTLAAGLHGDLNRNGLLDVGDVQLLVNVVLGVLAYRPADHDLNENGGIDIGDVQTLANRFLEGGSQSSAQAAAAGQAKKAKAGKLTTYRLGLKAGKKTVITAVAFDLNLAGTELEEVSLRFQRPDLVFSHRPLSGGRERVLIYSANGTPLPSTQKLCVARVRGKGRLKVFRPETTAKGGDGALPTGGVVAVGIPLKK